MSILTQLSGAVTYYKGWYGSCPEGPGEVADTIDLHNSWYASTSSFIRWSDNTIFRDGLVKVHQVRSNNEGLVQFNQLGYENYPIAIRHLYTHDFTLMYPGKSYIIAVKSGTAYLDIPEFRATKVTDSDTEYRLISGC